MTKKIVTRDDIKDVWDKTENVVNNFKNILDRPFKYSIWLTNLSLGLLGFYIALLLQIRSSAPIKNRLGVLLILIIIIIPVIHGLIFRIKFEIIDFYKSTKSLLKHIDNFIKTVYEKLGDKQDKSEVKKYLSSENLEISSELIEKWDKKSIILGVFIQFGFFILSLILVIIFLLGYILK